MAPIEPERAAPDVEKATTQSSVEGRDFENQQRLPGKDEQHELQTTVVSPAADPSSVAATTTGASTPAASDALAGFPLVAVIVGVSLGSFLMSLDVFIIATVSCVFSLHPSFP